MRRKPRISGRLRLGATRDAALLARDARPGPASGRLLDALPGLIAHIGPDGRHRFVNAAYAERAGMARERFEGVTLRGLLGEERYGAVRAYVEAALCGQRVRYQVRLPCARGDRSFMVHHLPTQLAGRPDGFFLVALDASSAGDGAAAGIDPALVRELGHEIRNAVNNISVHAQLLDAQLLDDAWADGEDGPTSSRLVMSEAQRIGALLDEFSSLSPKGAEERCPVDLRQLVETVAALRRPHAEQHGIGISLELPGGQLPITANGDALTQVLVNLVNNAIDAMKDQGGGALTIQAGEDGRLAVVTVIDTGPGIPAGVDIYRPFVTTKKRGTGLGLAVSQRIVQLHGGSLHHRPTPGGGATFVIELPRG